MKDELALFTETARMLMEAEEKEPVIEPIAATKLFEQLDLQLEEKPASEAQFQKALQDLVIHTPRTATRKFFNQLFGGRQPKAVLGELLAVMLNNSMYTYKVAGPMVGVEKEIIRNIARYIGFGASADGTIAPGGSMSNFMGMLMARDQADQKAKMEGLCRKMTLYTSADSHYSIAKNAAFMGVGREQVRYVNTDKQGRMLAHRLDEMIIEDIDQGYLPFLVVATAGTTVMGAFDPIDELSPICAKHNLWLHIDGAYCGAVLFSDQYRHLIKGVEAADSFSVNAHKMLGTPLTCSILVAKEKEHLNNSFAKQADYLYQTDDDEYNLGKISLQCGRRNDALKFWTLWKAIGSKGLGKMVDHQFALAEQARQYVEQHPDYTLYSYPESVGVCFNYRDIPPQELCSRLYEKGELMVGYGQFGGETFVRFVTVNANNEAADIRRFFENLEAFAEKEFSATTP